MKSKKPAKATIRWCIEDRYIVYAKTEGKALGFFSQVIGREARNIVEAGYVMSDGNVSFHKDHSANLLVDNL